ncbi:uncharacterized protein [Choristoneura fumiferana]|uniref:uncharacterized protein n=1 Tax=Choristoneura fumiferana TaxID=7141 RepID=UPI003D15BD07
MRRNNNMGMGGRGGGSGGPLMTNHLQDLELELELLKRKRQLIQQQQNEMLYRPSMGQTAYNPPRQMFEDRYDAPSRHEFSHLYEESPRDTRPLGPKRRAMPVWDNAPDDRFSGSAVPNKRHRPSPFAPTHRQSSIIDNRSSFQPRSAQRQAPMQSLLGPKPLMNFSHVPKGPAPRAHNFQTKFKPNVRPPGPNKPNISPKKLTTSKTTPKKPPSAPVNTKREEFILTADAKPRSKVLSRLEFALGIILKEMKAAFNDTDEHKALFVTTSLARVIKQAIRERLRAVMLGKFVGAGPAIVAEYRKVYPADTDAEIVKLAEVEKTDQDQKGQLAIKLLEEGDPELYFKKNVTKLLEVKLDEMFRKIEKSFENEVEMSEIVEHLPDLIKAPAEDSVVAPAEPTTAGTTKKHPREEEYDKWMSVFVERKLPGLLLKHKQDIIKVLNLDESFRATKAAIIMNANNKSLHIAKTEHNFSKISESSKDDPILPRNLPYFVKVHASPSMPKRKLMQEFLNQFNPKTIKRHKKNFNLLFVGFNDKEDYDKILTADQTKIGNATITIMGNNPKVEQSGVIEIKDEDGDALDKVLTPQLDDQINDLLSSIRKADEEAKEEENGEEIEASAENGTVEKEDKDVSVDKGTVEIEDTNGNDSDVQEVSADAEVVAVEDDEVAPLKSQEVEPPATPAKGKAPATPSTIRTRRASRLAQNN